MNDRLVEELEKRDRAVEEAVAMIVLLEAQVETLLKEREMVRHIESQTIYGRMGDGLDLNARSTTPKPLSGHMAQSSEDFTTLQRMPSFLSEHSETTENLRNVYLGARGSVLSLPRPGETPSDLDNDRLNRLASPSLSVLSESSFLSIYGKNNGQDGDMVAAAHFDAKPSPDARAVEGASLNRPKTGPPIRDRQSRNRVSTPSRQLRSNSITQATGAGHFQSLTDIVDQASPLQRLEQMDRTHSLKTTGSRQSGHEREHEHQRSAPAPPPVSRTISQRRTKEEKREALRRVMTDGPAGRLLRDQNLPPTPDTISTTTLRRYKNSADSLSRQPSLTHQQSYLTLSETTSAPSVEARPDRPTTVVPVNVAVSQPPSMTAFNSRKGAPGSSYFDNRPPIIQRPRSADETTTSHRKDNGWDSDSDNESDANSMASSFDIWVKDSWKPSKSYANGPGRASPDLFGFPTRTTTGMTNPWSPEDMFSSTYSKPSTSGGVHLNDGGLDDLIPVQTALFGASGPPPPPNRRSSLHAQTGSTSAQAIVEAMSRTEASGGCWGRKTGSRKRGHARRNSDGFTATSTVSQPISQQQQQQQQDGQTADGKQDARKDSHYPPITGQQNRNRGFNRFFRRSIGSSGGTESAPASATEATFAAAASTSVPKTAGIGIPSWIHRSSAADDERLGATPPPIMRNRALSKGGIAVDDEDRHDGGVSLGGGAMVAAEDGTTSGAGTPTSKSAANGDAATRRKWLPAFGRSTSQRTRG